MQYTAFSVIKDEILYFRFLLTTLGSITATLFALSLPRIWVTLIGLSTFTTNFWKPTVALGRTLASSSNLI